MTRGFSSREAYIALNMMEQVGPVRTRAMIEAFGSPEAIFEVEEAAFTSVNGIGRELARSIAASRDQVDPQGEEDRARRLGYRIVTMEDDEYPALLQEIYDPPLALYVWGSLTPADRHSVAVVGTRHATHYGMAAADRLAYGLAHAGFTVVSGLARGIDTAAHQAALKADGRTVAVLGGALDKLYPRENAALAERISEQGAVISEYPLGRAPDRQTFPYRNRIIGGLALGLLVVEAGEKSGAVIAAHQALEQGRHVFAVPGRIDNPAARGCHALIKNGAKLVETLDDIVDELQCLLPKKIDQKVEALKKTPDLPLSETEAAIVSALAQGERSADELARACGLSAAQLNAALLGLEMKRVIAMRPGRVVELRVGLPT